MSLFSQQTLDKAAKAVASFVPFLENMYVVKVNEIEVVQVKASNWVNGKPVQTEELIDNLLVKFIVVKPIDGEQNLTVDGKPAEFNSLNFWFDPCKTGISKKGPSKGRQFLAATLGQEINMEINIALIEQWITSGDLLNKELKVYLSVQPKDDGSQKNKIERFSKK